MAILTSQGFNVLGTEPIDSRIVVDSRTIDITDGIAYEGLIVYDRSDDKVYVLTDATDPSQTSNWTEVGASDAGPDLPDAPGSQGDYVLEVGSSGNDWKAAPVPVNLPDAPDAERKYILDTEGTDSWVPVADLELLPAIPATNGDFALNYNAVSGNYAWANITSGLKTYLPSAPSSDGTYSLQQVGTNRTWVSSAGSGLPSAPTDDGEYVLAVDGNNAVWSDAPDPNTLLSSSNTWTNSQYYDWGTGENMTFHNTVAEPVNIVFNSDYQIANEAIDETGRIDFTHTQAGSDNRTARIEGISIKPGQPNAFTGALQYNTAHIQNQTNNTIIQTTNHQLTSTESLYNIVTHASVNTDPVQGSYQIAVGSQGDRNNSDLQDQTNLRYFSLNVSGTNWETTDGSDKEIQTMIQSYKGISSFDRLSFLSNGNTESYGDNFIWRSENGDGGTDFMTLSASGLTSNLEGTFSAINAANSDASEIKATRSGTRADGDTIGTISFIAENSANNNLGYAEIQAVTQDVTDTSEDGALLFNLQQNSSEITHTELQPERTIKRSNGEYRDRHFSYITDTVSNSSGAVYSHEIYTGYQDNQSVHQPPVEGEVIHQDSYSYEQRTEGTDQIYTTRHNQNFHYRNAAPNGDDQTPLWATAQYVNKPEEDEYIMKWLVDTTQTQIKQTDYSIAGSSGSPRTTARVYVGAQSRSGNTFTNGVYRISTFNGNTAESVEIKDGTITINSGDTNNSYTLPDERGQTGEIIRQTSDGTLDFHEIGLTNFGTVPLCSVSGIEVGRICADVQQGSNGLYTTRDLHYVTGTV